MREKKERIGVKAWWKKKTKKEKTWFIVMTILFVISIASLFLFAFCRDIFGDKIGDQFLGEGVANGFVLIGKILTDSVGSVIATLLTIIVTIVVVFIINTAIRLSFNKTNKIKTIGSLLRSVLKYVAIIVDIAMILSFWGVDVSSIVAGLGILTLIVGLGCQTLIQDVVSGLFIIFDDYFSVGDMVIIDGFRGYVVEIGLKSIKIDDRCGNVKAITNSSINTVVNLSRQKNLISVSLDCGYDEDLDRVEAIIYRELPKIRERIPKMIEDPFYKGVEGFSAAGVTLGFGCFCEFPDRFQVERDFKREIYRLYIENNILVPFNQIVVNPADPTADERPHATEEDLKDAKALNDKNRIPAEKPVEKSFLKRAEDSLRAEKEAIVKKID